MNMFKRNNPFIIKISKLFEPDNTVITKEYTSTIYHRPGKTIIIYYSQCQIKIEIRDLIKWSSEYEYFGYSKEDEMLIIDFLEKEL